MRDYQLIIEASQDFKPSAFDQAMPPLLIPAPERNHQHITPMRAKLVEVVSATYEHSQDGPEITLHETVPDGADVKLVQAFAGHFNCYPYAPDTARGTLGPELNATECLGWPAIAPGVDVCVAYALQRSILSRARRELPSDYNPIPKNIKVHVRLTVYGHVVNS